MKTVSMVQWFAQQMTRSIEDGEGYQVVSFQLFHMKNGTLEDEILGVVMAGKQYEPKELANRFEQAAATHAAGLSGRQQFFIRACYVNDGSPGQYPFGKAGETQDIGLGTEGPTAQGHMGQMMRHNEALFKASIVANDSVVNHLTGLVEQMANHNAALMKQNAEAFEILKERAMADVQRDNDESAKRLQYERSTQMRQMFLGMLPGLLEKFTGQKLLPEDTQVASAFKALKNTLTPEQIATIAGALSPEQQMIVVPLLTNGESDAS